MLAAWLPAKNGLQRLRDLCTQHGTVLIIDEVKSGFRVAKGGAQELYGIHADLTTYAKAMGNGYPVAAFGGKAHVMDVVGSHPGGVVHGGTYTANLVALSAAHATLKILAETNAQQTINHAGEQIQAVLGRVFTAAGHWSMLLQDRLRCLASTSAPPYPPTTAIGA